ncbi:MAG: HD domain-containing protein [bacterium]|nr:HD domain-containing protein [bacterium]
MEKFSFEQWKNAVVKESDGDSGFEYKLEELVDYMLEERKKGKIPLIIVGAGASASDVAIKNDEPQGEYLPEGLPCLSQMIWKLRECVVQSTATGSKFREFKELFNPVEEDLRHVDREWLGKVFSFLESSADEEIKEIWEQYCEWFFFKCIEHDGKTYGALNTETSRASEQIAEMYDTLGAFCLSANFDNYINFALINTGDIRNGIPIFDKRLAEKYFKRNRRGKSPFEDPPYNQCVLHANGDVFWLFCSGEKGEGYCPETGKKVPAFTKRNLRNMADLKCEFCKSKLAVTMTMPGTYEKDYNTREIITAIWRYISTKISAVITVGLSCNWDDVLLKFVLQLIKEREIPLLDINDLSDKAKGGHSNIIDKVVKESHLESCAYITTALKGTQKLNSLAKKKRQEPTPEIVLEPDYQEQLKRTLEKMPEINRLRSVSQLGLKSYWLESEEENERWHHSIEVADIAVKMYEQLCQNSNKKESPFEKVLIYTAGLLHDCGHLPFSHLLEDVFDELSWHLAGETQSFKHGHYTKIIIEGLVDNDECQLREILKKYNVKTKEVIGCIEGNYGVSYMDAIMNSSIDADKIAYIFTDAENAKKSLALTREEFLTELLKDAYITQEGLIALDGKSAWYALRLLDERARMYEELYYDAKIRFLEAAVKYIITTYFVQKYNDSSVWKKDGGISEDLGSYHILMAIEDLYNMIGDDGDYDIKSKKDLSVSISEEVKSSIRQCMNLVFHAKKSRSAEPKEIRILKYMYSQLLGSEYEQTDDSCEDYDYSPVQDDKLDELVSNATYKQLNAARKKIILNYPGTILIDIYTPTKYFSSPSSRQAYSRIDGTDCGQEMILIPRGKKELWVNQNSRAEIGLQEYSANNKREEEKVIFHVFRIGNDDVACNYAINMLKKELAGKKEQ